ncbi:DUF2857 domain-containing protein [Pseudomonas sp. 25 R 14]|uniref:DUF2857 domain-containing protein n=1 Tax=Pseudomonas sp. 25 R 14 TaxID=1844109 RepID=UPI00081292BC|nr:DUF2857 domain-containing protein [Pseudomonas sp. 25 R 14]CRM57364.1 hypothetical protein [Pseudomonas sp. 25 R 14]
MSVSFNVLNQAMLAQVLHELRLGNPLRCKALGLSEDDIYLLQSLAPTTLSRLTHASVSWVDVKIDSPVLHRLIEQAERDEQNERLINRALKLGASSAIMSQWFGLAHSETALRRRLLKIETRKGRPQQLSEAQEHALWQRWCQLRTQDSSEDQLDAMMMLAEEQQISLTSVWQQIDHYSTEP